MTRKNPVAKNLRSPRYRKRVVESRVKYSRKKKHSKEEK
jgi:hypothetical protein